MTDGDKFKVSILLVEDNKADADLVGEVLQDKIACHLSIAKDGEQALAFVNGSAGGAVPDLILLDLNLPKLSGREVLRRIKGSAEFRHIPVLVFTSSGAERDIRDCYNLNANCYLQKPTDLEKFVDLAENLNAFWIKQVKLPPKGVA
jgi:CheY-like chemotaxis protein